MQYNSKHFHFTEKPTESHKTGFSICICSSFDERLLIQHSRDKAYSF